MKQDIPSSKNNMLNTDQNALNTGPMNPVIPVVYVPSGGINNEIMNKIMSSNYCYVKQDLESFFSACLGCFADAFKYKVYVSQEKINEIDKINDAIFRVHENEDCCMRINFCCAKRCKPGSLFLYPIKTDNLFGYYSYPCCTCCCCHCKCECCYCLGPPYSGYFGALGAEQKYGEMDKRSHWCTCLDICFESHRLFDSSNNSRFVIERPCCQLGGLLLISVFSGYYPLVFNILYNGQVVGNITRSAKAFCCGPKLYYFEISFPTMATFEERMLLIGFALRCHYMNYSQIIYTLDNF